VLRQIEEGGTYSQYDEPLFWLDDSMICNLCYKCSDPNVGLALNKVDSAVKCYMGDTGLLVSLAFNENEISDQQLYKSIMNGKLALNEGMLFENMIAQMITVAGRSCIFTQGIVKKSIAMILKSTLFFQMRAEPVIRYSR